MNKQDVTFQKFFHDTENSWILDGRHYTVKSVTSSEVPNVWVVTLTDGTKVEVTFKKV